MLALGQLDVGQEDADDATVQPAQPDPRDIRGAMAAFARRAARQAGPHVFYVWPEHLAALRLYLDAQTQWREGFNGVEGLDYAGVEALLRIQAMPRSERCERFAELQVMERAALRAWAKQRAQRSPRR